MLGITDLSLISGNLLRDSEIQEGGASHAAVSENFGGILFLGSASAKSRFLEAGSGFGSFGSFKNWMSTSGKWKKWHGGLNIWHQKSRNDYSFINEGQRRRIEHAQKESQGLEGNLGFQISKYWKWSGAVWLQKTNRQIPAALYQSVSEAEQKDEALRTSHNLQFEKQNTRLQIGYGFTSEMLRYVDPISNILSISLVKQHFGWLNWEQRWGKLAFHNQVWTNYSNAETQNFERNAGMQRLALLNGLDWEMGKGMILKVQNRTEWYAYSHIQKSGLAHQPSLGLEFKSPFIGTWSAGFYGKMRLATLNDLFWNPGGNPNLQPETGWTYDLNWEKCILKARQWKWTVHGKGYFTQINQYILWQPQGWIWSPKNLGKVEIIGFEAANELEWKKDQNVWTLKGSLHANRARNMEARFEGDESVGKQLPYMPVIQSRAELQYRRKNKKIQIWHQYTGSRSVDPIGNQKLPHLQLFNLRAEGCFKMGKQYQIRLFGDCLNLMDKNYQMVLGFPMPGRQFNLGVQLEIN